MSTIRDPATITKVGRQMMTAVGFFAKRGDDAEKLIAVGVATEGAYLAATSPDGVATDALDIKVAIAIGDSANVTAMIDPAGSVTPAALHNAITDVKSEMKTGLDTKADKQTVTDDLATKADKTDVDAQIGTVNKSVSDLSDTVKANKDDADKTLATKADKATVESDLATKANQSDLDKTNSEVAKKADSEDVKAQIDGVSKSISDVSDTVKANKDATDQALATKADKTTVEQELAVKANSSDVDKKLDEKADKSSVDAKINAIDFSKIKFRKQRVNSDGQVADTTWSATKNSDGSYTIDIYQDDWTAYKVASLLQAITTKADQSSLDVTNKTVATKANSADVYTKKQVDDAFSSRDATIATKADKATVDAEISKIDFTPYAKTADVDSKLQGYTNTADLTKLLDVKANVVDVYSKTELDKKLLDLSTDTDGKVNADQVSSMIANKVDKSDLASDLKSINDSIATKANTTDVNTALAKKDDTTDVDAKIKTVIDLANTKADKTDVTAQFATKADKTTVEQELAVKANSADVDKELTTKANASDVYTKKQVDDALSSRDTAIATKADKATVDAEISKIDFAPYAKTADVNKQIKTVTDLANSKVSADYSYSKAELDKKLLAVTTDTSGKVNATQVASMIADKADKTYVDNQIASIDFGKIKFHKQYINSDGQAADKTWSATKNEDGTYTIDLWNDDWTASKLHDVLAQLPSKANASDVYTKADIPLAFKRTLTSTDDMNKVLESGIYITQGTAPKNFPPLDTINHGLWGTILVYNHDAGQILQLWLIQGNVFHRWIAYSAPQTEWQRYADQSDITDLQNQINANNDRMNDINSNANGRLSLGGGNMNLRSTINWTGGEIDDRTGNLGGLNWAGGTDWAKIYGDQNNNDNLDLAFDLGDDSSNHFSFRSNGSEVAAIYSNGHFSGTVDWSNVSGRPDVNVAVPLFRRITAGNTWNDILGASNGDTPVLVSIRDEGGANTLGNCSAAVAFGGGDTKGVLNVAYSDHTARIIGGNGNAPVWHEDIAWKSDVTNLQNQVNTKASASDVNSLNQTISALQQTVQSLQNTVNQQATQITGLQTQVNNQANEIKQLQETTIKGKTFSKSQEAAAEAWEKQNSQQIAFILDN